MSWNKTAIITSYLQQTVLHASVHLTLCPRGSKLVAKCPHPLWWADSRDARGGKKSGIPNLPNYCV